MAAASRAARIAPAEPLAIYIHWPFCEAKCPYCDFNSHVRRDISEDEYREAVLTELASHAAETRGRPVSSVFFGGGTPSLMSPGTAAAALDRIAELWPIEPTCEITLEANPSSVEAGRFAGYRHAGVNRVSLGVQSLDDSQLRFLGRLHTAEEARKALDIAAATFERMSFDLIYARPGQTAADWRSELKDALALAKGHLSLYQLTIEPETAFFDLHRRGKLRVPDDSLSADLYEITQALCEDVGLAAYEVSNHAAIGAESRHNLTYWRYGDYLGIGPGAHGRITVDGRKMATAAIKSPATWLAKVRERGRGSEEQIEIGALDQAREMLLMGLRLSEGVDGSRLEMLTGYGLRKGDIAAFKRDGLLTHGEGIVRASPKGRLVLNALIASLAKGLEPVASRDA